MLDTCSRLWATLPARKHRPPQTSNKQCAFLGWGWSCRSLISKAARSAGPLINTDPIRVSAAEAPTVHPSAAFPQDHQGSRGRGGSDSQEGPCHPRHLLMYSPARGSSPWRAELGLGDGGGVLCSGSSMQASSLSQIFSALPSCSDPVLSTAKDADAGHDVQHQKALSFFWSKPPCSGAWTTTTAPITGRPWEGSWVQLRAPEARD